VQVRDGEVDHGEASPFALMDFEREEGKALACCATLQSDVVIEAEIDEEPDAASSRSRTSRPASPASSASRPPSRPSTSPWTGRWTSRPAST
jgi:hypothetical protein